MVALNVIIIIGIVVAGSFLLYFVGDFLVNFVGHDEKPETQKVLEIEETAQSTQKVLNSSVVVTDYIPEEAEKQEEKEEEEVAEEESDDEEQRLAEAREALERRKAEILKRMQAQIEEDEEDEEEEIVEDENEEEVADEEVTEEPTAEEDILGLINTEEEEVVAEEPVEDSISEKEEALQAEIERLKNQLGLEKEKYENLEQKLNEEKPEVVEKIVEADTLGSKEYYEAMLEEKMNALKIVEKDFKQSKKDFMPLFKVNKSLAKNEKKLHRREAVVAKQKVVLYGVNNYADIDEEKAKKLAEDLDLLDGLKLSVNHCKEVMEQNKERYPILERLYNALKTQVDTLKKEIDDINAILAGFETEEVPQE